MSIIVKGTSNNTRELPTAGLHNAVCVDVYELGPEETPYGIKEKLMIVWELDEAHPKFDGPFRVNKKYTASLHEKARLSEDLESWRGKAFTKAERDGFDVEKLVGVACQINVVHKETDSGTWANVKAIMPAGKTKLKPSGFYTRMKDRHEEPEVSGDGQDEEFEDFAREFSPEDGLPF